jgi:hypothetical protein
MNYEGVYQTLKPKLEALVPNAAVRLPNEKPADNTELNIDVSVSEIDDNIYTEISTKHDLSINLLLSVPVSTGTKRIHNIASRLVTEFDPLSGGSFWTDGREHFVRINSAGQRQPNISDNRYQINVRILATIYT